LTAIAAISDTAALLAFAYCPNSPESASSGVVERQAPGIQHHKADQDRDDLERGILFLNKRFHSRFHSVSIVQNLKSASNAYVFQKGHQVSFTPAQN